MNHTLFETTDFRIYIASRSVWVEASDGEQWVLKSHHELPVSRSTLSPEASASILSTAVQQYENSHDGDLTLRSALIGIQLVAPIKKDNPLAVPQAPRTVPSRSDQSRRPDQFRRRAVQGQPRVALRPPLRLPTALHSVRPTTARFTADS